MSAKSDKTTSYMQVTCLPMSHSESCYHCDYKTRCDAYTLIMDLTAERNVCPLLPEMEKCVVDQIYLPHVLAPTKEGFSVNPEEVNKNRKLEQANRYVKVSGGENRYDKVSVEALRKASESISLPRTKITEKEALEIFIKDLREGKFDKMALKILLGVKQ